MGRFKIGDKVKVIGCSDSYCSKIGKIGEIINDDGSSVPYNVIFDNGSGGWFGESEVTSPEKTLDTLEVGDVIVSRWDSEQTIIDVLPHSYVLSLHDDPSSVKSVYTPAELKKDRYTIKDQPDTTTELTIEQIAEKFNIPAEQVRIKDN